MIAVIFRATVTRLDNSYFRMAESLRELAFSKYGCLDFVSFNEGNEEITVSYWDSEQQIRDWKNDPQHQLAQKTGREKIYESYSVEICEVNRSYKNP